MEFEQPKKVITPENQGQFCQTQTFNKLMSFIVYLQKSVESKKIQDTVIPQEDSTVFSHLDKYLSEIDELIKEIPPLQQQMRFGNKAFQTWYEKAIDISRKYLKLILTPQLQSAEIELIGYLQESFGNSSRIDYGTGHELNFIMFLLCLRELGLLDIPNDLVLRGVFYKYIGLMRKLQLTYMLEPAGSHGVWGIDDYHFLPFLFGASELIGSDEVKTPDVIHNYSILQQYEHEFLYLHCIKFIKDVKKGVAFHECSPVLYDISGAASWQKVSNGLIKMYQAEVLFKLPVARHIMFGKILPYK